MIDLFYALISVFLVSLISIFCAFSIFLKSKRLNSILIYLVAFSAGALLSAAFFHLLPELVNGNKFSVFSSAYILLGILLFLIIEKIVCWHHCHREIQGGKIHSFAIMNLVGDGFHNFLDGIIIGASYLVNFDTGLATTLAVALHEIPQEIGDFGVLLHGGFSKVKALFWNFVSASIAILGVLVAFFLNKTLENIELVLIPISIGGFIYIAGSDLIPEMNREFHNKRSWIQILFFILGAVIIFGMAFFE